METLPRELLDQIFIDCDFTTRKNLRLVHRVLHDAVTPSVFEDVHAGFFHHSLAQLDALSRTPLLARHVRRFVFHLDILPPLDRPKWEELIDCRPPFSTFFQSCQEDAQGEEWFSRAKCRQWWVSLDRHKYSKSELDRGWEAWIRYATQQQRWDWSWEGQTFVAALARLPNLVRVETKLVNPCVTDPDDRPVWTRMSREILVSPAEWGGNRSKTPRYMSSSPLDFASVLLAALGVRGREHGNAQLQRLSLHYQHRGKGETPLSDAAAHLSISYSELLRSVAQIDDLKLLVQHEQEIAASDANAELIDLLRTATRLRRVDLVSGVGERRFYYDGFEQSLRATNLLRSSQPTWPHLQSLSLSANVSATADDLLGFLRQHSPTLRRLVMKDVICDDWPAVLREIPRVVRLDSIVLQSLWQFAFDSSVGNAQFNIYLIDGLDVEDPKVMKLKAYLLSNGEVFWDEVPLLGSMH